MKANNRRKHSLECGWVVERLYIYIGCVFLSSVTSGSGCSFEVWLRPPTKKMQKATTLKPNFYELSVFFFSTLLLMSFKLLLQLFLHPYIWHMWTNSHIHKEPKPKFIQLIFQTFDTTPCECEAPPLPLS